MRNNTCNKKPVALKFVWLALINIFNTLSFKPDILQLHADNTQKSGTYPEFRPVTVKRFHCTI